MSNRFPLSHLRCPGYGLGYCGHELAVPSFPCDLASDIVLLRILLIPGILDFVLVPGCWDNQPLISDVLDIVLVMESQISQFSISGIPVLALVPNSYVTSFSSQASWVFQTCLRAWNPSDSYLSWMSCASHMWPQALSSWVDKPSSSSRAWVTEVLV